MRGASFKSLRSCRAAKQTGLASSSTKITVAGFMKSHPSAARSSTCINLPSKLINVAVVDYGRLLRDGQFGKTIVSTLCCGYFFMRQDSELYMQESLERK